MSSRPPLQPCHCSMQLEACLLKKCRSEIVSVCTRLLLRVLRVCRLTSHPLCVDGKQNQSQLEVFLFCPLTIDALQQQLTFIQYIKQQLKQVFQVNCV